MRNDAREADRGRRMAVELRVACLAAGLLCASLLVSGCGGASPGSGVAHLGTQTTTGASSPGTSSRESSPGNQAVAYAACMRSHGVANFPDPQISHSGNSTSVKMAIPASIAGNPRFKPAQEACRKLLPGGGPGKPAVVSAKEQAQYLKAAACVRSHGVPNFPDPTFSSGGVHIDDHGLDESSPAFKAAVQACESLVPAGAQVGSTSTRQAAPGSRAAP